MLNIPLPHNSDIDFRRFRFWGEEAEILGQRLDAARRSFAQSKKGSWARKHWQGVIDRLVFQWRNLPVLHDSEASLMDVPRWTVQYDYYERDDGIGHGFGDKIYDRLFREPDFDGSWERAREERYQKALRGIM